MRAIARNEKGVEIKKFLSGMLCGVVYVFAGCCAGRVSPAEPADHMGSYRRVSVVEFYYDAPHEDFGADFARLYADRLSDYTEGVDVNNVSLDELGEIFHRPLDRGRLPLGLLTELREKYQTDAVVMGRVNSFSPYYFDLAIGISIKAVDTGDGTVFFSDSNTWNAGELERRGDIEKYYKNNYGSEDSKYYGPELLAISPSFFAAYVADRLARKMLAGFEGTDG